MRIKLKVGLVSNFSRAWEPGDEIDLPDDEARRMIAGDQAEPVPVRRAPEAAATFAPENAAAPAPRNRK